MNPCAARLLAVPVIFVLSAALSAQGGLFGSSVAVADVDGDGFGDVLVGEPEHDGASLDEGRVLLFRGSAAGPEATPSWTRNGMQARAHFGATVAALGDVNGDGYEDVAVGAPDFDVRQRRAQLDGGASPALRDAGLVAVFLGSASGLSSTPALFQPGIQQSEHVGAALARAGDVNGDGFDDVLVGATGTNGNRGAALLFAGSAAGVGALPLWFEPGLQPNGRFASVLSGGDVNGDGFADVMIGAPDDPPLARGWGYLYYGSAAGLPATHDWAVTGPGGAAGLDDGNSDWGAALSIATDLNGDGRDEVLVSNPNYDVLESFGVIHPDAGNLRVYRGNALGDPTLFDEITSLRVFEIATVGDLNTDDREDVLMSHQGIYYGRPSDFLGRHVSIGGSPGTGGDVDGDGFDDFVMGRATYAVPEPGTGRVQIHRGLAGDISTTPTWTLDVP